MGENRKINRNLIDPDFLAELNSRPSKEDVILKTDKIKMDNLDPDIVSVMKGWQAPAGSGYNDKELRDRIIVLENDHVSSTNNFFDKTKDLVTPELLNSDIKTTLSSISANTNRIAALESTAPNKADVRYKNVSIDAADLDKDLYNKIMTTYGYYMKMALPTGSEIEATDLATVNTYLNDLKKGKADASSMINYRLKSDKIIKEDLATTLQDTLDKADAVSADFAKKANVSDVDKCRKTADKIEESDLSSVVANKLNTSYGFATDVQETINTAVNTKGDEIKNYVQQHYIGDLYNQNAFTLQMQRQVISQRSSDAGVVGADSYAVLDVLKWLHLVEIGDKYDQTNGFNATQQQAICQQQGIAKDSKADYYGIAYGRFSMVNVTRYLMSRIEILEAKVATLESKVK